MRKAVKKSLSVLAAIMMSVTLPGSVPVLADTDPEFKTGIILIGDETEGYTSAHIEGIKDAAEELGMDSSEFIWKYKVPADTSCYDAAVSLAEQGCSLVISNSYGHQDYVVDAAREYPDVTFVSMTGDYAAVTGLPNFKNAYTDVFEARYVSGVVAGMKLAELIDSGALTPELQPESFDADGNVKIGYVGAFSYAEVVSGYTAFFLGVRRIVPNVVMEVRYTNSWFDVEKEAETAEALIEDGAVIVSQHADSTGAPAATQKMLDAGKICYNVGYNVDMLQTAPQAALTSATNNWKVYYKHLFETMLAGEEVETDWSEGYAKGAVSITPLGESCAPGTAEKVAEVEAQLKNGEMHVFDTSTFTYGGVSISSAEVDFSIMDWSADPPSVIYPGKTVEVIKNGCFEESVYRSAPYFALRIDGIKESQAP